MAFTFTSEFNPQPTLQGDELSLRPVRETDRDALAQAASDPNIWAGHPARERHKRPVFDPYFDMLLSSGAALIIEDMAGRTIGCTAYYTDTNAPTRLSIGFTFLVCAYWGGQTNRIVKRLTLEHLFLASSEAWFHIAPDNIRSQVATTRLGAIHMHDDDIDLGGGTQSWKSYCLTRENWMARERA